MPDKSNNSLNFWQELKRRKVIRVIPVYAAASFVLLELVDIITEPFGLPDWTLKFVFVLLCVGFIIAVILSWVYDITPEGVQKTKPVTQVRSEEKRSTPRGWKIATYVSVLIIIAFIVFYIVSNIKQSSDISKLEKSIAVLPFINWNNDEEYAHMGDAIANEIITQLFKINEFRVHSFTSTSQYRGADKKSIPQIGKELGANFIIEGTIEPQEENVCIQVQVIQATNDNHIWADEFKGKWKDIFTIRANIALKVAEELKTILSPAEIEKIEKNPTHNSEAYKLYLKARHFQNTRSEEGLAKAISYYQGAIHLDPDYALAYSGLAHSYTMQNYYGYMPKHEILPKVKETATRALEIDNKLGEAHFSLGLVRELEGDFFSAEQEYKLSIELNHNDAEAHHRYSYVLSWIGKNDEAIREAKTAQELEPVNPVMMRGLGYVYYLARKYDLAIKECDKCLEIDPGQSFAYLILFYVYNQKAMYDDATSALEIYLIVLKKEDIASLIRKTFEESGYIKAIRQLLDVSMEQSIAFFSDPYGRSVLFALIGDKDKAFEWLEKTYEQREVWLHYLKVDPMYDSLRSDPRFQDLLKRMNLPDN